MSQATRHPVARRVAENGDPRGQGARAGSGDGRRHPRRRIELPVVMRQADNRVRGRIVLDASDLSEGGVFLRSSLLFEIGEELEMRFRLPDGHRVAARGRVVRVTRDMGEDGSPGMAVEFIEIEPGDGKAIRAFVENG